MNDELKPGSVDISAAAAAASAATSASISVPSEATSSFRDVSQISATINPATIVTTTAASPSATDTAAAQSHVHATAIAGTTTATPAEDIDLGPAQDSEEEPPLLPKRPPSTTVYLDHEILTLDKMDGAHEAMVLALPADTDARVSVYLENMTGASPETEQKDADWVETLSQGRANSPRQDGFAAATEREGSQWRQGVPSEKGVLAGGSPRVKDNGDATLTGEAALLRVRALTGLGVVRQIPLWHSGFWVTLRAPTDAALIELSHRLAQEKITLGRQTHGLSFSNTSVFFSQALTDFAIAHIYSSTLHSSLLPEIRKHISSLDIPLLIWGLAWASWPHGFVFARAALNPTAYDAKILKGKINLDKACWTDLTALTEWQTKFMATRTGTATTADMLARYKSEFTRGGTREIKVIDSSKPNAGDVTITLKVPNLEEYLNSGQKWVNNIVTMADKSFGAPPSDIIRDNYITQHGKATSMRQYGHWVESIKAGQQLITEEASIDNVLDAMSGVDEIRTNYTKEVRKFMEDSCVSMIGITAADASEASTLPRFQHIQPLEPMSTFFILLVQRTDYIQTW